MSTVPEQIKDSNFKINEHIKEVKAYREVLKNLKTIRKSRKTLCDAGGQDGFNKVEADIISKLDEIENRIYKTLDEVLDIKNSKTLELEKRKVIPRIVK